MLRKAPESAWQKFASAFFEVNHRDDRLCSWPAIGTIGLCVAAILAGLFAVAGLSDEALVVISLVAILLSLVTFMIAGMSWAEILGYSLALFAVFAQIDDLRSAFTSPMGAIAIIVIYVMLIALIPVARRRRKIRVAKASNLPAGRRSLVLVRTGDDGLSPLLELLGIQGGSSCAVTMVTDYCRAKHLGSQPDRCRSFNDCSECPHRCVRHLEIRK